MASRPWKQQQVYAPATTPFGFVIEGAFVEDQEAKLAILEQWLNAGHTLGNHTYSHRALGAFSLETFEADILRGQILTKEIMRRYGRAEVYLRLPFLMTFSECRGNGPRRLIARFVELEKVIAVVDQDSPQGTLMEVTRAAEGRCGAGPSHLWEWTAGVGLYRHTASLLG